MPSPTEPSTALSIVPAAGSRRGQAPTGTLKFFYGPMDCGKSTLALQLDHNHSRQGRRGLLLTRLDRSHHGRITSRMGITRPAVDVDDDVDLAELVRLSWAGGRRVDYLIVDEAQFFTPTQIDQLAQLADDVQVDVYAFGIATDFRGRMFPGSTRLFELADEVLLLQVEVLCCAGAVRPADSTRGSLMAGWPRTELRWWSPTRPSTKLRCDTRCSVVGITVPATSGPTPARTPCRSNRADEPTSGPEFAGGQSLRRVEKRRRCQFDPVTHGAVRIRVAMR